MNYDSRSRTVTRLVCRYYIPANGGWLPHVVLRIDEYLTPFLCHDVFTVACNDGASEHILDFLLLRTAPVWKEAVRTAARGGHLHVLRWMTKRQDGRGPWKADFDYALKLAATHGHLDVVKWLYERGMDWHTLWVMEINNWTPGYSQKDWLYRHCSSNALKFAAEHGHFEVVKWVYNTRTDTCEGYTTPMSRAVASGYLAVAKWLYSAGAAGCSFQSMDQAATNGHLQMLQWLQSNSLLTLSTSAMDGAAGSGHFEIVKWLHRTRNEGCSSKASYNAANNGHLAVVERLYKNMFNHFFNDIQWSSTIASEGGHLNVLQWLHEHFPTTICTSAMDAAASCGHLDVIMWLHEHQSKGCPEMGPFNAARNGHLTLVKWCHTHHANQFVPEAMERAAQNGHLEVVQWLHENRCEGCTTSAMEFAASKGHLDVVLYLLEHRTEGYSSDAMTDARAIDVQCLFSKHDNFTQVFIPTQSTLIS